MRAQVTSGYSLLSRSKISEIRVALVGLKPFRLALIFV
jgi:hypothetical protein